MVIVKLQIPITDTSKSDGQTEDELVAAVSEYDFQFVYIKSIDLMIIRD